MHSARLPRGSIGGPARPDGRGAGGQVTVETALLYGGVVIGLVAMALYAKGAYQGYLYSQATVHGSQFDPRQPYQEQQTINQLHIVQDIDVTSGTVSTGGVGDSDGLPSVPDDNGVPDRILETKVRTEANWDISREAQYEVR